MNLLTLVLPIILLLQMQTNGLDLTEHEDKETASIFFDFKDDDDMLQMIELAERQLKIFIYPIPDEAVISTAEGEMMGHFKIENLYRKYLRSLRSHVSGDDSRHDMVVEDPSVANAFIIDNDYMRLTRITKCHEINHKHMKHIVENVVDRQPYFNRSNGDDHFFMAVYDKSYCDVNCESDMYSNDKSMKRSSYYRILGANAIGNYGMDAQTFSSNDPEKVFPCHRPNHDIVVPQLLQDDASKEFFTTYHKGRIASREFDSTFAGASWGERKPLETMVIDPDKDYANGCERFIALTTDPKYKLNGNPDCTLMYRGYFMYDPCGLGCWSRRKYEAFMHYTIPIIVTSGGIQAFEKFIDWSKISVKMTTETWMGTETRAEYRKQLRVHVDKYRQALHDCWSSIGSPPPVLMNDSHHPPTYDDSWVDVGLKDRSSKCGQVFNTLIWKKTSAIQKAVKWFDFTTYRVNRKNAFRLLTLEIWCRIKSIAKTDQQLKMCNRPSDYTARKEYV